MYSSLIFLSLITRVSELRLAVTGIPSFITLEQSLCPPRPPPLTMRLTLQGAFQKGFVGTLLLKDISLDCMWALTVSVT